MLTTREVIESKQNHKLMFSNRAIKGLIECIESLDSDTHSLHQECLRKFSYNKLKLLEDQQIELDIIESRLYYLFIKLQPHHYHHIEKKFFVEEFEKKDFAFVKFLEEEPSYEKKPRYASSSFREIISLLPNEVLTECLKDSHYHLIEGFYFFNMRLNADNKKLFSHAFIAKPVIGETWLRLTNLKQLYYFKAHNDFFEEFILENFLNAYQIVCVLELLTKASLLDIAHLRNKLLRYSDYIDTLTIKNLENLEKSKELSEVTFLKVLDESKLRLKIKPVNDHTTSNGFFAKEPITTELKDNDHTTKIPVR